MSCVANFFTYETTKSVVVKSWTIGVINRAVQLLIISYFIGWVFLHEKAYQIRDTSIESSVVTKVKGFGKYSNQIMDTADYVTPPQVTLYKALGKGVVRGSVLSTRGPLWILTGRCVDYNTTFRTCQIQGWCPAEVDNIDVPVMLEAENFTLFIKNSIRFPLFNFEKGNLLPNITTEEIQRCHFDPIKQPFCPILRLGDIVKFAGQNFASLAKTGGIIGIKIGWVCDLDHSWEHCIPRYSFNRLDSVSEKSKVSRGYNFRYAKYYKQANGTEFRTLIKAYGIRFDVLVYGNAGKFNIIPTLINTVAAFTSVGVGTVLCDIILLNFLKGADQYKAKKFEEVSETVLHPDTPSNPMYRSNQTLGDRCEEKQSTDSGAFSIGL
uniref:P2X purinoceptor n=1 Tax=Varanus komodoensis TaxID=61221 RepID=A0A8D2LGD8_VARKO